MHKNGGLNKKILVVCTTDSMIWNFLQLHIKFWEHNNLVVECACAETGFYFRELSNAGVKLHKINFERNPFKFKNYGAFKDLKDLVKKNKYDLIVCQEPVGGVIARIVAYLFHIPCIYTAHGFHFYKGSSLLNWMLFYPVENILSRVTNVLIVSNEEDLERAKKMHASSIDKINGIGIDFEKLNSTKIKVENKKKELNLPINSKIILNASELIPRKNHETAIKAFKKANLDNTYYLICGSGPLEIELKKLVAKLGIENEVRFLGFRKDLFEIYKISDVFLFPSLQEGLSISLLLALSSNIPVVCSNIRGNIDVVKNKENGLVFSVNDVAGFSEGLQKALYMDKEVIKKYNEGFIYKFGINEVKNHFYRIILLTLNKKESGYENNNNWSK